MIFSAERLIDNQLKELIDYYLSKKGIIEDDIPWIHLLMNKVKDSDEKTFFKLRNLEKNLKK